MKRYIRSESDNNTCATKMTPYELKQLGYKFKTIEFYNPETETSRQARAYIKKKYGPDVKWIKHGRAYDIYVKDR